MSDIIKLIQRQVPLDSRVKISMRTGEAVVGILTEIGRDHVTLENNGSSTTVLADMISTWTVLEKASLESPAESLEIQPLDDEHIFEGQYSDAEIVAPR